MFVLFDEFFLTEFLWEIILSEKCTIFDNLGRERVCNFKIVIILIVDPILMCFFLQNVHFIGC